VGFLVGFLMPTLVDRRTGKSTEGSPKFIKSGDSAIVTLIPDSQKATLYEYFFI
jgi:hypothetical protein